MKFLLFTLLATLAGLPASFAEFTKDQYLADFDQCVSNFKRYHTPLYEYISKEDYESYISTERSKINDSTTFADFYNIITALAAYPRCLHSFCPSPK